MALSQFGEAHAALETARAIQEATVVTEKAAAAESVDAGAARLRRGRARTLQTAGKVMRYRGALLRRRRGCEALALYQHGGADASSAVDGGGSEDEWGAAATLHELGVVSIRRSEGRPPRSSCNALSR